MFKQSPITEPMKIPTLQFLGAKDRRVPYRQGLLFDAITKQQGTAITTYVYENSAHSLSDSVETSIDIIIKSIAFME
jgi:acylaminoacyl-peptidase